MNRYLVKVASKLEHLGWTPVAAGLIGSHMIHEYSHKKGWDKGRKGTTRTAVAQASSVIAGQASREAFLKHIGRR